MKEGGYYNDLGRAFDKIADSYDREIGQNAIFRLMKKTNLDFIKRTVKPSDNVLEIGCGTGEDAIELAKTGAHVVATDISKNMIRITEEKARCLGIKNLDVFNLSANNLESLEDVYGRDYFDGAYSSFGVLNCEPDLETLNERLAELIKPTGYLICSVMNKYALNEILLNLALLKFNMAFQRLKSPVLAPIAKDMKVKTRYYSGREFSKFFKNFRIEEMRGLSVFFPPPYMDGFMQNKKRLLKILCSIDTHVSGSWPFNEFGDHVLLKLRKIENRYARWN